jgi:hypothetical protein
MQTDVELGVNAERRRAGEVAIGILGETTPAGFCWVTVAEAREFMARLRIACRDSEDWANAKFDTEAADRTDLERRLP